MYVLGLESSTLAASVAVVNEKGLLAEYTVNTRKTHSERLLPLVDSLLSEVGIGPTDLSAVAVAKGPGSFTGVRIGVASALGLARSLQIPLFGIPTLEALAAGALPFPGLICPILDARRQQVYTAIYRGGAHLTPLTEAMALSLEELFHRLQAWTDGVVFIGDAVEPYREIIERNLWGRAFFPLPGYRMNRAAAVAHLALARLQTESGDQPAGFTPLYVRLPEAERNLLKREGKAGDD